MTRCATSAVLFALALFSLAQPAAVPAVVLTWNVAGGGNWDTTSPNWSGDATVFPDDATADVVFNNTAGGTIAIASNMTPASVTVSAASGTYTFTGGPIDGAGGLTKSGDGLLVINSANSFTGTTTINYGRITISHAGALGLGGGNITAVGSNGNNGSLLALTGGITVNGALRLQAISSGRASLINAGGSNVWAGTIDITGTGNHAMLQVDSGSLTVTGDITGTLTSGNFYIRGSGTSRITGSININSNLNKRDGGTWIIGNTTTPKTYSWNATNVELGVLGFAAANIHPATRVLTLGSDQSGSAVFMLGDGTTGYNQTVAGLVTGGVTATRKIVGGGSNVATLTVNNSGTYTFNGTLGGTGTNENNLALKKTGTAELTLGGHNTYTGVTTVERGRLTITHANALGSTAGGTILAGVADGGEVTLVISGGITVAEPLHLSASVQRANLQNGPGDNTWAGPIDITSAGSQQPMIYSSTNGTLTVTGDISGANTPNFYIRGTGTTDNWLRGSINITGRLFKRDTGTWMLGDPNGAETYSWLSTTVEAGILKFAAANVHPASAVLTLDTNQGQPATFMLGNGTTGYNQTVAGLVTGGTNDTRKIVGGGANVATLTVNNSANYTYSGTLGGTGTHENNLALTKSGSGSLTLSGATPNTYAGLTTVSGGTFILAKSTGVDAVGGDVTVSGGTLQWNQDHQLPDTATLIQTGGTIAFSGMDETLANFTKSGGTTQTGGNSAVITITETFSLSGGTTFNFNSPSTIVANRMLHTGGIITLGASGTLLDIGPGGLEMTGSTITLNPGSPGATIRLGGDVTVHASTASARIAIGSGTVANTVVDLNGGTRTFTVANGAAVDDLVIDAFIRNGGLIKAGDGTMLVTGANTYAGTTAINAGTLVLNGAHAGGGAYTVAAGATLAGFGSTNAPVFVENDGVLSPGNSPGALTIGSLTLADTSLLTFELDVPNLGNSTLSDRIDVTGDLLLNGILNVEPLAGFGTPEVGDRWRLFNYTGSLTDLGLDVLLTSLPALSPELRYEIDTSVAHQVDLVVGVPEPSSLLLMALGLLVLLARRRP